MSFIINADTPDDARNAIVEWLERQAQIKNAQSTIASRKREIARLKVQSQVYTDAAEFIQRIDIQPLKKQTINLTTKPKWSTS